MEIQRRFSRTVFCLTTLLIAPVCQAIDSSPGAPFLFTDTNTAALPVEFYRVLLGP
jgi:hypothetical protein